MQALIMLIFMKNRGGTLSRTEEKERVFNPDEKVYRECFISLK